MGNNAPGATRRTGGICRRKRFDYEYDYDNEHDSDCADSCSYLVIEMML
ncbi:MAG TPA: hypothetical protein PKO23_19205 [Candidatus Hydrogenedentes bacterium]|nr:hypothetical protein [Candidatus Hydrogenedentota bacterium]